MINKQSYNPGDVFINTLNLSSPRGTLNFASLCMSCNIYESIFTPGIIAIIEVLDTEDYLGTLKLSGDETVNISFEPPGGFTKTYTFSLNSVDFVEQLGSMKAKVYKLSCVSTEAIHARANHVQKSYNTQISNMIQDVFKTFLNTSKNIEVESTRGLQRFVSPNVKPFTLINTLRKRAVSLTNKSSNFMFFENSDGYKFKTIESMMKSGIVKYLKQEDTVGSYYKSETDNNIIAYRLHKQMSAIDRVGLGSLNQKVGSYDVRTNEYKVDTKKPNESDYTFGSVGSITSSFFRSLFGKTPGKFTYINQNSIDPPTFLNEGIVDKSAYLAGMLQNQLDVEVPGDTILKAGECVYINIPKKVSTTGFGENESLISGKFLMAKVAHIIKRPDQRPRYVCSLECIKGSYEEGVS